MAKIKPVAAPETPAKATPKPKREKPVAGPVATSTPAEKPTPVPGPLFTYIPGTAHGSRPGSFRASIHDAILELVAPAGATMGQIIAAARKAGNKGGGIEDLKILVARGVLKPPGEVTVGPTRQQKQKEKPDTTPAPMAVVVTPEQPTAPRKARKRA